METHQMNMRQPAIRWQDGLPTGNGTVGALMYGQICSDQILLNHEAVWHRECKPNMVDISDLLPEYRKMILNGDYRNASGFLNNQSEKRGGKWCRTDSYQPVCDIRINTTTEGPFCAYRRGVDFSSGLCWVQWRDERCSYKRELFASRADDVVVLRVTCDKAGSLNYRLRLEPHDEGKNRSAGGFGAPPEVVSASFTHDVEIDDKSGSRWLTFAGDFAGKNHFGALGYLIVAGGAAHKDEKDLVVSGADEMLLLVKLLVQVDDSEALNWDQSKKDLSALIDKNSSSYEAFLLRHSGIHQELFASMQFDIIGAKLPDEAGVDLSNEELLLQAYDGDVPAVLVQRMFDYGRHLLICSSTNTGWPANLQGIWNGDFAPAWSSDYHNDENIQMNYWQALPGNLFSLTGSYFDYYERFIDDFRENAGKIFGCRGILIPIAQTTNGLMYPGVWANWISAAGWLAQLFYDYYLFTGDKQFLENRAVPWLKETAAFYEDFLIEGDDGRLVFCPSLSPENVPTLDGASLVTINATMDVAICREVLGNLCEACELLNIEIDKVAVWQNMMRKLPEYETNEDGAMKEWLHPAFPDNYHHRHQSHIYPVFPGFSVTEETNPEIYRACNVAVEKRLVIGLASQSGWSMAHMANIYARLGNGDRALECIEILLRSSTGPNLFTYHNDWRIMGLSLSGWGAVPPFQIDANFGITAAVLEMLVFSAPGIIKLLPAVPASWEKGRASGIACRGQVKVDLRWDFAERILEAEITSGKAQTVTLKFPHTLESLQCCSEAVGITPSDFGERYRVISLPANEKVAIRVIFSV